jgi:hypothetical protein
MASCARRRTVRVSKSLSRRWSLSGVEGTGPGETRPSVRRRLRCVLLSGAACCKASRRPTTRLYSGGRLMTREHGDAAAPREASQPRLLCGCARRDAKAVRFAVSPGLLAAGCCCGCCPIQRAQHQPAAHRVEQRGQHERTMHAPERSAAEAACSQRGSKATARRTACTAKLKRSLPHPLPARV